MSVGISHNPCNETLVLTFWESKEVMDNYYYSKTIYRLSNLVQEVKLMFKKMPERITYNIVLFHLTN